MSLVLRSLSFSQRPLKQPLQRLLTSNRVHSSQWQPHLHSQYHTRTTLTVDGTTTEAEKHLALVRPDTPFHNGDIAASIARARQIDQLVAPAAQLPRRAFQSRLAQNNAKKARAWLLEAFGNRFAFGHLLLGHRTTYVKDCHTEMRLWVCLVEWEITRQRAVQLEEREMEFLSALLADKERLRALGVTEEDASRWRKEFCRPHDTSDPECAICYKAIKGCDAQLHTWCKCCCEQYFHKECVELWKAKRQKQPFGVIDRGLTKATLGCAVCWEEWLDGGCNWRTG